MVDLPGCYSLMAHSAEEEVARDFICFGGADVTTVVCDATCLERNINLVLQTLEITSNAIVCINLMDEAKKKHIRIDLDQLSHMLGVPVIGCVARSRKGLDQLMEEIAQASTLLQEKKVYQVQYPQPIESAVAKVQKSLEGLVPLTINARWVALRLLEQEESLLTSLDDWLGFSPMAEEQVQEAVQAATAELIAQGLGDNAWKDAMVSSIYQAAEKISAQAVYFEDEKYNQRQLKVDKILTGKWTGVPIMLLLLCGIFWLTITGANYPSGLLADGLFWIQDQLTLLFQRWGAPEWLHGALVLGVYRVLAWVVSVMLPPMAIFFPLFTLLEDLGYLPRVAFNLDRHFKRCCACGKQALTMWVVDEGMQKDKKGGLTRGDRGERGGCGDMLFKFIKTCLFIAVVILFFLRGKMVWQ